MYTVMNVETCKALTKQAAFEIARNQAKRNGQAMAVVKVEGMFGSPTNVRWQNIRSELHSENEPELIKLMEFTFGTSHKEWLEFRQSRDVKYWHPRNFHILFRVTCCHTSFNNAGIIYGKHQATSRNSCQYMLDLLYTDKAFTRNYASIISFIKTINPNAFEYDILQREFRDKQ
ncbi:MAG TPA: hypothetical protein DCL77_02060 [Prolixibacteraceae bacterium]|jgi:hypothetical protein|nr:hypothetical protein [Prolixibacteraceae bacterium]